MNLHVEHRRMRYSPVIAATLIAICGCRIVENNTAPSPKPTKAKPKMPADVASYIKKARGYQSEAAKCLDAFGKSYSDYNHNHSIRFNNEWREGATSAIADLTIIGRKMEAEERKSAPPQCMAMSDDVSNAGGTCEKIAQDYAAGIDHSDVGVLNSIDNTIVIARTESDMVSKEIAALTDQYSR